MNKFAFITAASENYLPALQAQVNSIRYWHGDRVDIILLAHNLPMEFLDGLPEEVIKIYSTHPDQVQGTAIERFRIAVEYGADYEAICLLDADVFLEANCDRWFEVAKAGFIVTGSNGMIINFGKEHQDKYGVDLGTFDVPYAEVHSTVPIFLSPADLDWFDLLYNSKRIDSFDDFLFLNILGIKLGKDKRMICLPPFSFTGLHHWQVKPETAIMFKGGMLLSGTEEKVYTVHGKWFDETWRNDLWRVMGPYLKNQDMGEWCVQRTKDAIELGYKRFCFYRDLVIG